VAEEAEGLRLHLSSTNSTGYVGVYVNGRRDGRFRVILTLDSKQQTVGIFGTAVEGAVAYARAVGGEQARAGRAEAEATLPEDEASAARITDFLSKSGTSPSAFARVQLQMKRRPQLDAFGSWLTRQNLEGKDVVTAGAKAPPPRASSPAPRPHASPAR